LFDDISTDVGPWKYGEERMYEFFKTHTFESQQLLPKPRWQQMEHIQQGSIPLWIRTTTQWQQACGRT
jgi:hypothetical protein